MQQLHVGSGTTRGALTVFPIWGEYVGARGYTTRIEQARLGEQVGGPSVGALTVTNLGDMPVLMLEGLVLEGGWQNRMLARSVLVGSGADLDVEVICVEQGRWGGGRLHSGRNRRASNRVRSGLRSPDRQGEVWRRVQEYDARYGANETASFTEHADRAGQDVSRMVEGLRPLAGQVGVVIALAGQPVGAEVFDSHTTLRREFDSIIRAAAMDAVGLPELVTPSRRARRFVDRAARVRQAAVAPAGLGRSMKGGDQYAEVSALLWNDREVHLVLTNPRHQLNLVGV